MTVEEKIEALIVTRVNGNSIRGNKTYENMINSVKVKYIWMYAKNYGYDLGESFYRNKIDMIESMKNTVSAKNKSIKNTIKTKSKNITKAKTKKQIIELGKENLITQTFQYKMGLSEIQTKWVSEINRQKDGLFRVIEGPTGMGKTYTKQMVLSNIESLTSDKSIFVLSVPSQSQSIIKEMTANIKSVIDDNVCILLDSKRVKESRTKGSMRTDNVFSFSYEKLKECKKSFKHIIVMGSHQFLRKILPDLNCIEKDRRKYLLVDEAHREIHTDGVDRYTENTENHISSYSSLGINLIKDMIDIGYVATGFTGTPSKQQREDMEKSSDIFSFYVLEEKYMNSVKKNNTWLESARRIILDHVNINNKAQYTKNVKTLTKIFKRDVFGRKGTTILYLGPERKNSVKFKKLNSNDGIGFTDYQNIIEDGYFNKENILEWFGGVHKGFYKNGRFINCSHMTPEQTMAKYPNIKLIVAKELIKEGVDYKFFNHIIVGSPILKKEEFLTWEQRIGRGVRQGGMGLLITFTGTRSDWENENKLIKKVIKRGTIIHGKEAWDNIEVTPDIPLLTAVEAEEIAERIMLQSKDMISKINKNKLMGTIREFEDWGDSSSPLSLKDISDPISKSQEMFVGHVKNMASTGGTTNIEDGFILLKSGKTIGYDTKSKVLVNKGTKITSKENPDDVVAIKASLRRDGKINNQLVHIIFYAHLYNDLLTSFDVDICVFDKKFTDTLNSGTIRIPIIKENATLASFRIENNEIVKAANDVNTGKEEEIILSSIF